MLAGAHAAQRVRAHARVAECQAKREAGHITRTLRTFAGVCQVRPCRAGPVRLGLGFPCAGSGVLAMAEPLRFNALVTITRIVGLHPKLGDLIAV